jgi:PhnB protein
MAKQSLGEQLNRVVNAVLAPPYRVPPRTEAKLGALGQVADALRGLPREEFRSRLKSELQRSTKMASKPAVVPQHQPAQSATVYICVHDAAAAIDFYKRAFGAEEVMRLVGPGTRVGHAEIRIGNSMIMLSDEFPEYGTQSPRTLGGSPARIHLQVDDVDTFAARALAAGATQVRPIANQFYGERAGVVADPFGFQWHLSQHVEDVSVAEVQRRFEAMASQGEQAPGKAAAESAAFIREGFHTVTPYVIAKDAARMIDFMKVVFGAEEMFRDVGSAGGVHAELRIGDSMMMIGGGAEGLAWNGESEPMSFHIYVDDTDAVYLRAIEAGAVSLLAPVDMPYGGGERNARVKDSSGNHWYIGSSKGGSFQPKGANTVQPYLHPLRAEPMINFLKRGLGATEIQRVTSPDGVIRHASMRIGDSVIEMGEARDVYQPLPGMFYLYVPDAVALYRRAIAAGATSLSAPEDMPYGDRVGQVKDVFGYTWCLATHLAPPRK